MLKAEVEKAERMLKDGKSPGVENIPADILQHGGPCIMDAFTVATSENLDQWTTA